MSHTSAIRASFILMFASLQAWAEPSNLSKDLPDKDAIRAFQEFWKGFEEYEEAHLEKSKKQYQLQWDRIKQEMDQKKTKATEQQIEQLKEAARTYESHLREHPEAENRPHVIFNLARVNNLLAEVLSEKNEAAGAQNLEKALGLLKELSTGYPAFSAKNEVLYLRALLLEKFNRDREAIAVWRKLASSNTPSIHSVYANLAVGDHYFNQEEPAQSIGYYQIAETQLEGVEAERKDYERIRIQYRTAWAAYRAANLDLALKSAMTLITPGRVHKNQSQSQKIRDDAIDLIGDSLYEKDDLARSKAVLKRPELNHFAHGIGTRILRRYHANRLPDKATKMGAFLIEEFPLAADAPIWLNLTAGALNASGKTTKEIEYLERLAMMLPERSLWRSHHRDHFDKIRVMEELAVPAAKAAAAHHYDHGLASGNVNSYMSAATFYEILINFDPNGKDTNKWRARHAHSHYFAGKLDKASKLYTSLKEEYKLKSDTLEVSSYQLVLTREKQWRNEFSDATEKGEDPQKSAPTIEALKKLEEAVNDFANRFPSESRSVDLLLVAASANRDHERFETASRYWERVLVSQPTTAQRAMAIRGLIASTMKKQDSGELVKLSRRFLKLEDWSALGTTLGNELKGVLASATFDEGQRLNHQGSTLEAGILLVKIAQEFPNIPKREKIYRDGAYTLAIAGDWPSAFNAASSYMSEGLKEFAGDMQYLVGRANEYQMRFANASSAYITLGKKYPNHSRAITSLERAENLAVAEDDFATAGEAAELLGDRAKKSSTKVSAYGNAIEHYNKADLPQNALAVAKKQRAHGSGLEQRLVSDLEIAKAAFQSGDRARALESIRRVADAARKSEKRLNQNTYAAVAGEANYLLGEEAKSQFDDFSIFTRAGGVAANVRQKTRYFEALTSDFDRSAAANHPEFSTRARFELAAAAESFADELSSVGKRGEKVSEEVVTKYKRNANRLRELAKKYYSSNLLARTKNPKLYQENEWVKKSAIKLTGYGSESYSPEIQDSMPTAIDVEIPQQWSL